MREKAQQLQRSPLHFPPSSTPSSLHLWAAQRLVRVSHEDGVGPLTSGGAQASAEHSLVPSPPPLPPDSFCLTRISHLPTFPYTCELHLSPGRPSVPHIRTQ